MLPLGGAVLVGALWWRLGVGPFVDGIALVNGPALLAAAVITLFTTVSGAWRWQLVSRGLGVDLSLRTAITAYYRSQFLNSVLPGGVLGDVDRGVGHGLNSGNVGLGLRAVVCERIGGQVVQTVLVVAVLTLVPSPVRSSAPVIAAIAAVIVVAAVIVFAAFPSGGTSIWARGIRALATDLRLGVLGRATWPGVLLASCAVTAGHAVIFLIAGRAAGVTLSPIRMLPLAVLVLLAMSVPTNLAGWGPREGVAAWAFSAAGLGAGQGVTVAVVYGVLAFVSCLPGAAILVVDWLRRRRNGAGPVGSVRLPHPAGVDEGSKVRG
ncbi:MAG: lysylphosphatidylglycerol synthase transmembrane domain-containing protein [Terrimesophilobacter sp.]